ncbi:MAG TPA: WD40 repeat domain-containing protein, partial [Bryobacteraceae bacterium]|nr:WD40 repeat domain-containing protein [Bryobacteraceae bacterium]
MATPADWKHRSERILARYLACEAERVYGRADGSAELGMLLAATSLEIRATPQGYGAVQCGLRLLPKRVSAIPPVRRMWAVATSGTGIVAFAGHGLPVQAVNAGDGRELWRTALDSYVTTLSFSPDESVIMAGCVDGTVRLLAAKTGREAGSLKAGQDVVAAAASARAAHVAIATAGRTCTVWRCAEKPVPKYLDCGEDIAALGVSGDGKRLAAGNRDGLITVWDVETRGRLG